MSESITHNQKLDKDCAKSIVEQLESLNIAPSENRSQMWCKNSPESTDGKTVRKLAMNIFKN